MRNLHIIILYSLTLLLTACSSGPHYRITVLQCSVGNWRYKLNNELLAAQHLYDQDVEVEILNCHDQSDVQVRQIDSLLNEDVDLLVVAPNEYAEVAPALRRAKERGKPVILFDRKADTDDYTAFIGGDNEDVGRLAANYAVQLVKEGGGNNVLEITALQSTSPSRDRHKGFEETISQHPEVDYQCIFSNWDDHRTDTIVRQALQSDHRPDIIFCHSDFMARGASWAVKDAGMEGQVKIIGVDGLPGPGEGIEGVEQGWLAATCVYPTQGERIVKLALDILEGKPYERNNFLQSMVITPVNVGMVALYSSQLQRQSENLVTIQDRLEEYFGLYNVQSKIIWAAVAVIVLLIVAVLLTWRGVVQIRAAHRRQKAFNKEQKLFYTNASHQLKTPLTLIAGPVGQLLQRNAVKGDDLQLLEIAERNISQMENVLSDVLNFGKDTTQPAVDDSTAQGILQQQAAAIVEKEHLGMLKQEDTEELSNILIVDDNADMRHYLRTLLASRFYVLEAPDGQSGLQLARESVPDIVISDVMMPVMDGLQFCQSLKQDFITSHIPVILLTARSTEAQQMEGYEHGADAYMTKPFSANLLISRIDNLLRSRQQLQELFKGGQVDDKEVKLTTQDKLFMDHLRDVVREKMANPKLKMDDLGDELGISRVQLYRKVKVLTGLSPVELLKEMRLERAKTLLNSTTKTVAEIAYEVGFTTPSYFTTCFKKQFGKLPMEFRAE
ncbi:MAG: substrate-binding domain-containing protein [Prevotella sp.]|nr:substrate-binding domain-containing protein [Prevotella sp.]